MDRKQGSSLAPFRSLESVVLTTVLVLDLGVVLYLCIDGSGTFTWYFGPVGFTLSALVIIGYWSSIGISLRLRDICKDDSLEVVNPRFSLERALRDVAFTALWGLISLMFVIGALLLCIVHILAKVGH